MFHKDEQMGQVTTERVRCAQWVSEAAECAERSNHVLIVYDRQMNRSKRTQIQTRYVKAKHCH